MVRELFLLLTRKGAGGQVRSKAAKKILQYRGASFCPTVVNLDEFIYRFDRQRTILYDDFNSFDWDSSQETKMQRIWTRWDRYYKMKHLNLPEVGLDMFPDLQLHIHAGSEIKCVDTSSFFNQYNRFRRKVRSSFRNVDNKFWNTASPYGRTLLIKSDTILQWFVGLGCNAGCGSKYGEGWFGESENCNLELPTWTSENYCNRCRQRVRRLDLMFHFNFITDIFLEIFSEVPIEYEWRRKIWDILPPGHTFTKEMKNFPSVTKIYVYFCQP